MQKAVTSFDPIAERFVMSAIHQSGRSLSIASDMLGNLQGGILCDLGCGAGHMGRKFCEDVEQVVFIDPAKKMLETIAANPPPTSKWCSVQSVAESLPLESESVDIVVSRLAAHHFQDTAKAFSEVYRILRPGGRFLLIDLIGPGPDVDPELYQIRSQIELLHDSSHRTNWYPNLVLESLEEAKFCISEFRRRVIENPSPISLDEWCQLTNVPQRKKTEIFDTLSSLSDSQLGALGWTYNNEFELKLPVFVILGEKPNADH